MRNDLRKHTLFAAVVIALVGASSLLWLRGGAALSQPPVPMPEDYAEQTPLTGTLDAQCRPVSIVAIGPNRFAFADYKNIHILALSDDGSPPQIIRPALMLPPGYLAELPSAFASSDLQTPFKPANANPTGLFFDADDNTLYIANYGMRDLLVGKISPDLRRIKIERVLRHPALVSPENLAVSRRDNLLVVADFDGAGVLAFDLAGNLLWKHPYTGTHGVLIHRGHLYVCNMVDPVRLAKFDLKGNLLLETKRIGRSDGKFLYPSTWCAVPPALVEKYGGPLLLVDAHQGSVTVLDESLNQIRRFGNEGRDFLTDSPGSDTPFPELALPYGMAISDRHLAIADTYNSRLLFADHSLRRFRSVNLGAIFTLGSAARPRYRDDHPHCSDQKAPDELVKLMQRWLPGDYDARLGHQSLYLFHKRSKELLATVMLPFRSRDYGLANRPAFGFSFCWAARVQHRGESYVLVGSPFACEFPHSVLVVDAKSGLYDCVTIPAGMMLRPMDGDSDEPLEKGMLQHFVDVFRTQSRDPLLRRRDDVSRTEWEDHLDRFYPGRRDDDPTLRKQLFHTATAGDLYDRWLQGEPIAPTFASLTRVSSHLVFEELHLLDLLRRSPRSQP